MLNLAQMADEEATAVSASLTEQHQQLQIQLYELAAVTGRQAAEARDFVRSRERKTELADLVDKLSCMKRRLRFQDECCEQEQQFKRRIMDRRIAFQKKLRAAESRHAAERADLVAAQQRIENTIHQIRLIEIRMEPKVDKARRMAREREIAAQQNRMKMQKEAEFMREIQLCKMRHLSEINDLEIRNSEELHDLQLAQQEAEFELRSKLESEEAQELRAIDKLAADIEVAVFGEKQQMARNAVLRTQKRQDHALAKAIKATARLREKEFVLNNRAIATSGDGGDEWAGGGGVFGLDASSDGGLHSRSSSTSNTNTTMTATTTDDIGSRVGLAVSAGGGGPSDDEAYAAGDGGDSGGAGGAEAARNMEKNKGVGGAGGKEGGAGDGGVEERADVKAVNELRRAKLEQIRAYQKKAMTDMRSAHRGQLVLRQREHKQAMVALLAEHAEEMQAIRTDQKEAMDELLELHHHTKDQLADNELSHALLGMMLPSHILAAIERGTTPQPEQFRSITIFFTDIYEFKTLLGVMEPENALRLLNVLHTKFDEIILKYDRLYKVESVQDTYMVAAGLNRGSDQTDAEIELNVASAMSCIRDMTAAMKTFDFRDLTGGAEIKLRIGVHSGPVFAGLVGTKMSRYCLFGDSVNTASRMCTTGQPGKVQVSPTTLHILRNNRAFQFVERGEVEVKGKGLMKTSWFVV